ncbi:hypothetical protein IFR04_005095 [Cadophora malorum]|uniref:Fungal N-terminal domain-containing protein n=1 Tax=Cadophora malorum TaxID=108018 RepID=A0A8H7TLC2_9HELO|nr:hypothetical protein IFR04_005095 [Cadophora malorum]
MSDPLSAAGTAVGIVSLGLQVSQGLITYYTHFKAHDVEIANIVRKSEALQHLLQALEGPLEKAESGSGDVSKQVRGFVVACEAGLKRLLVAAEKYGNSSIPSTMEDKIRALRKRALYPFKRGTLEELNSTLVELTANLQLALQLLTLSVKMRYSIAATFSATRGPGGLAISPQLTLRAVVPDDSPAFSLLKFVPCRDDEGQSPDIMDHAKWVLYQLNLLFEDGKASPMDVTQDGRTLLHMIDLMTRLFDEGLAVEGIRYAPHGVSSAATILQMTMKRLTPEKRLGTLEVSDILNAILCQDEVALQKAVARFPEQVKQPHHSEMTPLHVSATWPEGVVMLLQGGAEVNAHDIDGCTPLWHAFGNTNCLSASLLLDHDSPVGGLDQNTVLKLLCRLDNVTLKEKFIHHLVDRRKRLWDLALEQLTSFEFEKLGLQDDRILDAQASIVSSTLLEHGIEIGPALMPSLQPRRTTVYHTWYLDVPTARMLFEAGFRDIDELEYNDLSPFWCHVLQLRYSSKSLELLKWLKAKGADVYHQHPKYGGTAMHDFGAAIGDIFFRENVARLEPLTEQQAGLAASYLQDDATDDCLCACSKSGCRIITSVLKDCRNWWKDIQLPNREWSRKDICLPVCVSILQLVESDNGGHPWMPFEVIRVMTFEWLELTHTCHMDPENEYVTQRGPLSKDEIHEIREEERYLLAQHEQLVSQFETKFTELGLPIIRFLEEHWAPDMIEVLEENQTRNVEEEQKMRELGVVVDEQDRFQEVESDEEDLGQEDSTMEDMDSDTEPFYDCEGPSGGF